MSPLFEGAGDGMDRSAKAGFEANAVRKQLSMPDAQPVKKPKPR